MQINLLYTKLVGRDTYYPDCDVSSAVCEAMRIRSFVTRQVDVFRKYNWTITVKPYKAAPKGDSN